MKNIGKCVSVLFVTISLFFQTSCSNNNSARRIDPKGQDTITTVEGINLQDWRDAATRLSESLLSSGVLGKEGKPDYIAISDFVNNTSQQVDPDMILKDIRTTLNKSGQAQTITTVSSSGKVEDSLARKESRKNEFLNEGEQRPDIDYTMSLKMIEQRERAGNTRQAAYIFQMSLTDAKRGVAVWEDEATIVKQGDQPAVGW